MTLNIHPDEIVAQSDSRLLAIAPHWSRIRLSEIAEVQNGYAFRSSQFSKDRGIPLIRIRDVGKDETDINFFGDYDERYIVDPGDIVVGMDGDFRAARWKGPRALLNQRVCRILPRDPDRYDENFMLYALPGYLAAIHEYTSSVTVKHLSSRTIEEIPLPCAPRPEQEAIVGEIEKQFTRLDAAVASLRRVRANLKRYRLAVTRAAVQGPSKTADETKWTHTTVEKIGDSEEQVVLTGPFGTALGRSDFLPEGIPVLTIGCLTDQGIDLAKAKFVSTRKAKALERYSLRQGDLLFSRMATVGVAGLVTDREVGAIANYHLMRLRLNSNEVVSAYFVHYVRGSPIVRNYLREVNHGATRDGINSKQLLSLPVLLPPIEEQGEIVKELDRRLSIINELEREVEAGLKRAARFRQSVLSAAFTGGLV
ncbi:MAG: restriction endonuclease subunit S [Actinomycetota bacterium]|nr:restriction endonuclease subunit S [Actinomycetota bacterium]